MELYFGKYQRKSSYSAYTLGKLECSGKEEVKKGGMPQNCEELAIIGHSLNGFYAVKGTEKKEIEMVYCDFNLAPNTIGILLFFSRDKKNKIKIVLFYRFRE